MSSVSHAVWMTDPKTSLSLDCNTNAPEDYESKTEDKDVESEIEIV